MKKLISFDLYADMGFLKKPDINEKIYLTYNMLHKPTVLGLLGAIAGLQGFSKNNELPEYYEIFKHLPVGIKPIGEGCENGNFQKTVCTYTNTVGFANSDGNLIVSEQTLINPAYRIFLLVDLENEHEQTLYDRILQQEAEYIPYLGKNDYSAWWSKDSVKEYKIIDDDFNEDFKVDTIFQKQKAVVESVIEDDEDDDFGEFELSDFGTYMYFERLPVAYCEKLYQYKYADFAMTDSKLKAGSLPKESLYRIKSTSADGIVVELNVQLN